MGTVCIDYRGVKLCYGDAEYAWLKAVAGSKPRVGPGFQDLINRKLGDSGFGGFTRKMAFGSFDPDVDQVRAQDILLRVQRVRRKYGMKL